MRRGCWRGNVILVFKYMKDCYCFRDTDSSGPSLPDHFPGPLIHSSLLAQMVKNLPAMQETQVWSLGWEDPLEKGMVTHFSILAWRIPRAEEPGELQSMGSQTVGGNRVPFTSLIHSCWSSIPSGVGGINLAWAPQCSHPTTGSARLHSLSPNTQGLPRSALTDPSAHFHLLSCSSQACWEPTFYMQHHLTWVWLSLLPDYQQYSCSEHPLCVRHYVNCFAKEY